MNTLGRVCGLVAGFVSFQAAAQLVVYDNLAPAGWQPFYAASDSATEFGDEVTLADNTPRRLDSISFQLYAENLSGDEWLKMRLYQNDGPPSEDGFPTPSTVLYESGSFPLGLTSGRSVLTLDNVNVTVPDTFTWTVQFGGLASGETAGLSLNGPPREGDSYDDFWEKNDGIWGSLVHVSGPMEASFGAQITAVPEPPATPFVLAALLCGTVMVQRAFRGHRRPAAER